MIVDPDGWSDYGEPLYFAGKAGSIVNASAATIANWRRRGILTETAVGPRGLRLYSAVAVRAAEREVRRLGLERTGVDPRSMRKPKTRATSAA